MVGVVEAAVVAALVAGEPRLFSKAVPELTRLIAAAFLGEGDPDRAGAAGTE
jgi:hypothetical protein